MQPEHASPVRDRQGKSRECCPAARPNPLTVPNAANAAARRAPVYAIESNVVADVITAAPMPASTRKLSRTQRFGLDPRNTVDDPDSEVRQPARTPGREHRGDPASSTDPAEAARARPHPRRLWPAPTSSRRTSRLARGPPNRRERARWPSRCSCQLSERSASPEPVRTPPGSPWAQPGELPGAAPACTQWGRPEPDPIGDAIAALTAVARRERIIGAGTPSEHTEPVDFGEVACHVITAVAANVGGVEVLLAGRPGSWEADYVRQIVLSTAGDDVTELLRWRTEPVRIEAADEALFEAHATAEERSRMDEIRAVTEGVIGTADQELFERSIALMEEAHAIREAITQRAVAAGDPLAATLAAAETAAETAGEL